MCYVLTDKWILAPNLRIPKTQFTDHMKLKEKEVQKCGCFDTSGKGNKIFTGVYLCRAETEGKLIQRLSYLAIPIYSHQTQTLLRMPRMLAEGSLIRLSPEKACQSLAHTDSYSQPLN